MGTKVTQTQQHLLSTSSLQSHLLDINGALLMSGHPILLHIKTEIYIQGHDDQVHTNDAQGYILI